MCKRLLLIFILTLTAIFRVPGQVPVVINEILACNGSVIMNETTNFAEYIELYNTSTAWYNFSGIYLSDDASDLKKWKILDNIAIAPKGFLLIWCDKRPGTLHSNFSLNPDGETIYLTDESFKIIDSVRYKKQFYNVSYGRYPNGYSRLTYFPKPTPNKTNNTADASIQLDRVTFNRGGGFYSGPVTLVLSSINDGAKIYYTTDGSEPNENSTLSAEPIEITKTKVIRARSYADGFIPSDISTQTYFINERNFDLPVVSLSTTPAFFFDNTIGIYVYGTNGKMGNGVSTPANFNQDWERPVNFEIFDIAKKQQASQLAGVKISGAYSRKNPNKSLTVMADDKYSKGTIDYQFFRNKKKLDIHSIMLRNSGNDFNESMMRDGFMHTLIQNQLNVDYLSYQPSVMFLNGQYYGILNIREDLSPKYLHSNFGIDDDSIDMVEWNGTIVHGTNTHYVNMIDYLKTNDISQSANYDYISAQMDIDEYIDYVITQIFIGNNDWPGNNSKWWRLQQPGGKWRWILYDTDFGFGIWKQPAYFNMIVLATLESGTNWPNPDWATFLLRTLLKNETFRQAFINRFTVYLGTTFRSERTGYILDSCRKNITYEMPFNMYRWGGAIERWWEDMAVMRDYSLQRPGYVYRHLLEYFGLGAPLSLTVHSSINGGSFIINDVITTDTVFKGQYFKKSFLKLQVLPPGGYKFKEWRIHFDSIFTGYLIAKKDTWKYIDNGVTQDPAWISESFDDSGWKTGRAQFGFGENDEKTVLDYGTDTNNKHIAYYFRKKFDIADTAAISDVTLDIVEADGAVVYLNGSVFYRINMPGTVTNSTLASSDTRNVSAPVKISKLKLVPGTNTLAVEVHLYRNTAKDASFDLSVSYQSKTTPPKDSIAVSPVFADTMRYGMNITAYYIEDTTSKRIIINEISASNNNIKDEYNQSDDWIELFNPTDTAVDIGGLFLTDTLSDHRKFRIPLGYPAQTTVAAKGYIRLWADEQPHQGKLHLGFDLNRFGKQTGLCQMKGTQPVWLDSLSYPYQDSYYSYGRWPDGANLLQYMPFTPMDTNMEGIHTDTAIKNIVLNEIGAYNTGFSDENNELDDWIELYNPTDDTIDISGLLFSDTLIHKGVARIPYVYSEATKIAPKGFKILWCDKQIKQGPLHLDMKLNQAGQTISISQVTNKGAIRLDTLQYLPQVLNFTFGRYKDGEETLDYLYATPNDTNRRAELKLPAGILQNCAVYPNPVHSVLQIQTEEPGQEIKVINANGETIINQVSASPTHELNLENLPSGLYLIIVNNNGNGCRVRIFKE